MVTIKMVLNDLSIEEVKELILEYTGTFSPNIVKITMDLNNNIEIVSDGGEIKDTFYGRKIKDKYYFARHEAESTEKPHIDYYDEFFCNGTEILI